MTSLSGSLGIVLHQYRMEESLDGSQPGPAGGMVGMVGVGLPNSPRCVHRIGQHSGHVDKRSGLRCWRCLFAFSETLLEFANLVGDSSE